MEKFKALSNFMIRTASAVLLLILAIYVWNLGTKGQEFFALVVSLMLFLEWIFLWGKLTSFKKGIFAAGLAFGLGSLYIFLAALGFWNMLHHPSHYALIPGIMIVLWIMDSGSYIIGSILKGPKLAPSISAGKTWSGFIGGTALGVIAGSYLLYDSPVFFYDKNSAFILTVFIPFLGQFGDLLESKVKRILNVKDSSSVIPGHGGLLDRFDSALIIFFLYQVYQSSVVSGLI